MRLFNFADLTPAGMPRQGFRSGNIGFHDLMQGTEGSPENYGLQLVQVPDSFSTPRHRHNFEQVRIMLDGSFGFGDGQVQHKGSVGYFCEGTYYTQAAEGASTTLLLQIGGPTRQGFMNRKQLLRGVDALAARGSFVDGVFSWRSDDGKLHNQDSYEAVWEHVHGKPVRYPKPQYHAPILLEPDRFTYRKVEGSAGVTFRQFGRFNEYGLELSQLKLEAGSNHQVGASRQPQLLFCLDGNGLIGGKTYDKWTSAEVAKGERVEIRATAPTELFVFGLPVFSD